MCGRYTLRSKARSVAEHFELDELPDLEPRYNIAPTQDVAVVGLDREGRRTLGTMHWGFPRKRGGPQINLRDDTAVEAPRFRTLLSRRRCLVVADGWYEWQVQPDGSRLPHYIRLPGGGPFAFAGVWNRTPDGLACTIMTCPASEPIAADSRPHAGHRPTAVRAVAGRARGRTRTPWANSSRPTPANSSSSPSRHGSAATRTTTPS